MNPDDPLEQLKALRAQQDGGGDDPLAQLKALKGNRPPQPTARKAAPVVNDVDNERGGILTPIQHAAEAIVSGLPFGQRAVAGYRGIGSLLAGHSLDEAANEVDTSLRSQRVHVDKLPAKARVPLQLIGGAPAAALAAPLGVVGGGAAVGAAYGADKPASTLGSRLGNTATGAVVGGATSKLAQLAGKGISNVSNRLGITDAIEGAVDKVSPKLASVLGTRGQVNNTLARRQGILEAAGADGPSAAQQQLEHEAATSSEAQRLYGLAEADQQPLNNPRLRALLADPRVSKSYQSIASTLEQSPRPLPSASTNTVLSPRSGGSGLLSDDDVGSASAIFDKLYGTRGAKAPSLPDPRALALLKRELYAVAKGKLESPLALKQEEAQQLLPIVDEIRNTLHAESPAWKAADQFFAGAKGEEQAFGKGFNAFRSGLSPSSGQLAETSPEALSQYVNTPRYRTEPTEAIAARGEKLRAGIKGAIGQDVANAPVTKDLSNILRAPSLAPTQAAQQIRSLAFSSPEDASALEQALATARGKSSLDATPPSHSFLWKALKFAGEPDRVATARGQSMLADRLGSPSVLTDELANYQQVSPLAQLLSRFGAISAGGEASR